jgi:hypothetical protein
MKIYKTQAKVEKDIKNSILRIDGDVKFECPISINASIFATGDIIAENIIARDIGVRNIIAWNIIAENISYHAFCCSYHSIECTKIKARGEKHQEPICLDGKLIIKDKVESLSGKEVEVKLDGKTYTAVIK